MGRWSGAETDPVCHVGPRLFSCFRPEGSGLGSAVTDTLLASGQRGLFIAYLAVRDLPGLGSGQELLARVGIAADHIAAARRLVDG